MNSPYILVRTIYYNDLGTYVAEKMREGYAPIGGVAIGQDSTHATIYCQAMVYKPNP